MLGPLCELILYVEDMAAQVEFYHRTLGLPLEFPTTSEDWSGEYWVVFGTGTCRLALHGGGRKRPGEDIPKFVFAVEDIASVREQLHSRGVDISEVRSPAPGVLVADARDPEGHPFSIEQQAPA